MVQLIGSGRVFLCMPDKQHDKRNWNISISITDLKLLTFISSKLHLCLKWFGSPLMELKNIGGKFQHTLAIDVPVIEYANYCSTLTPAEIIIQYGSKTVGYCKIPKFTIAETKTRWEQELTIFKIPGSKIPVGSLKISTRANLIKSESGNSKNILQESKLNELSRLSRKIPNPQQLDITSQSIDIFRSPEPSLEHSSNSDFNFSDSISRLSEAKFISLISLEFSQLNNLENVNPLRKKSFDQKYLI